jgi:hypothetical protein
MTQAPGNAAPMVPHDQAPVVPVDLLDEAARDAGKGVSSKPADLLIPIISILQQNSPQVDRRGNAYVAEAEAGDFFLRGALRPICSGIEGIVVQPVEMLRRWIEWRPARQGYVTEHDAPPADAEIRITSENGIEKTVLARKGTGNIIVDTRQFFVRCMGQAFMLPCYSTLHTFARGWQSDFHLRRHPTTGAVLPAFLHSYRLTTFPDSNAKGKWFGLKFEYVGPVSAADYACGQAATGERCQRRDPRRGPEQRRLDPRGPTT